jgi:uncharacterized protein (TIGR02246 family)
MRGARILGLFVVLAGALAYAQPSPVPQGDASAAISRVLQDQQAAWNRGDVDDFMHGYKDSPDTTFIGKSVAYGYAPILARYKKAYPNKDAMGTLDFADIAVRPLDASYAVVTGKFHLARSAAGGGDVSGIYSLVFEKTPEGWKIILDHSNVTTP